MYDGALCTDATTSQQSGVRDHTASVAIYTDLQQAKKDSEAVAKDAACWTLNCPIFGPQNDRGAIARNRRIQAASPDDGSKW